MPTMFGRRLLPWPWVMLLTELQTEWQNDWSHYCTSLGGVKSAIHANLNTQTNIWNPRWSAKDSRWAFRNWRLSRTTPINNRVYLSFIIIHRTSPNNQQCHCHIPYSTDHLITTSSPNVARPRHWSVPDWLISRARGLSIML